jgi:hypothetical protein
MSAILGAMGELATLLDRVEWQTTGPANARTTRGSITFANRP